MHIEPGMPPGHVISFFEEGEPVVDGEPGDLKFMIRQPFDGRWERRGNDLLINETISLVEALVGFERELEHLDGHKFKIGVQVCTGCGPLGMSLIFAPCILLRLSPLLRA